MFFLLVWILEEVLVYTKVPSFTFYIIRLFLILFFIFDLQKSVFGRLETIISNKSRTHRPLTFKNRLFLTIGPLGTWGSLSLFALGVWSIWEYTLSHTPLQTYQVLWLLISVHMLALLLFIPKICAFYPILFYLKHSDPFRRAYTLSQTWRFPLLLVVLLPFLVVELFFITHIPSETLSFSTAPLFVPYTLILFFVNIMCVSLLCLSLVKEEVEISEQQILKRPFISGHTSRIKEQSAFIKNTNEERKPHA